MSADAFKRVAYWAGPTIALASILVARLTDLSPFGLQPDALITLGITLWMAIWWISETVSVGATSLIPLAAFPMCGITSMKEIAKPYMNPFIVLLMAGFMAALAIERWQLHRRMALSVLVALGRSPRGLIFAMMVATAIGSMWISNTATTLIMLPIGIAVLSRLDEEISDRAVVRRFGAALFLGVAYAASIGGMGTPIGTPPNLIFMGQFEETFGIAPSFLEWMSWGLPLVIVGIPITFWYLVTFVGRVPRDLHVASREILSAEHKRLGPMTRDQWTVALIFSGMILLWVTRAIRVGDDQVFMTLRQSSLVGWAPALGIHEYVHDSTVAVLGALVLFAWPSRGEPGERLLDWPTASKIPWEVVLLFGGGIALATAFKASGLSTEISTGLTGLAGLPEPVMILAIALIVTFLTEVTSNTATTNILMPILALFAAESGLDPISVMLPAVLAASCAFMLPVATAPNAIVYGTRRVSITQMARAGFAVNLGGAVLITTLVMLMRGTLGSF